MKIGCQIWHGGNHSSWFFDQRRRDGDSHFTLAVQHFPGGLVSRISYFMSRPTKTPWDFPDMTYSLCTKYLPEPAPSDQVYGRLSTRGVSAREKPWHQLTSLAALAGNSPDASRWFHRPDESVLLETSVQYKPQDCWSLTTVSESQQLRKDCNCKPQTSTIQNVDILLLVTRNKSSDSSLPRCI